MVDGFAGQQAGDDAERFVEAPAPPGERHLRGGELRFALAADPHAQHDAARGQGLNAGDLLGRPRRVAQLRQQHPGAEPHALRHRRGCGERARRVQGRRVVGQVIADSARVETNPLGEPGRLQQGEGTLAVRVEGRQHHAPAGQATGIGGHGSCRISMQPATVACVHVCRQGSGAGETAPESDASRSTRVTAQHQHGPFDQYAVQTLARQGALVHGR